MVQALFSSLEQVGLDILQTGLLVLGVTGGAALTFGVIVSLVHYLGNRSRVTSTESEKVSYSEDSLVATPGYEGLSPFVPAMLEELWLENEWQETAEELGTTTHGQAEAAGSLKEKRRKRAVA